MHPFARMLWKEYRSLRMLWVGCVLGTFALWGVFVLSMLLSRSSYQIDDTMYLIWTLAMWLPAIYIIGCNAALYAGEREERTAEWLTNMAVPLRPLLTAKLTWPVLSAIVMQFVLAGGALLIEAIITGRFYASGLSNFQSMLADLLRIASFAIVEALVLSWFWSLRFSRPLTAAAASAISLIVVNAASGSVLLPYVRQDGGNYRNLAEFLFGPWGAVRTTLGVVLLILNGYKTRNWLSGRSGDWTLAWPRLIARRSVRVAEIAAEPATAWQREWRRFCWLEWQSIRVFLRAVAVAAVGLGVLFLIFRGPLDEQFAAVWLMLLIYVLPLMAGLAAWNGEQTRQQFRFFVNRGVSPVGLWLNKFVMWLTAMFAGIALLLMAAASGWYIVLDRRASPMQQAMWARLEQGTRDWAPIDFFLWSLGMLFASAFAAALYARRPILAIGGAFLAHIGLTFWLPSAYTLQLPVWVGIVPVAAWLVWCSLRQVPRWALERTGWRTMVSIAADWCVFPVLFAAFVTAYWIYSVPNLDFKQVANRYTNSMLLSTDPVMADWQPIRDQSQRLMHRANGLWWESLRQRGLWNPDDTLGQGATAIQADSRVRALEWHLKRGADISNLQSQFSAGTVRLPDEQWFQIADDVRQFRDTILSRRGILHTSRDLLGPTEQHLLSISLLFQLAEQNLLAHDQVRSEEAARAAVRYLGGQYAGTPLLVTTSVKSLLHRHLHDQLLAWAEHPDNSPETIALLLKNIETTELRWWMTDLLSLEAEYKRDSDDLDIELRSRIFNPARWVSVARERRKLATAMANLYRFQWITPIAQRNFGAFPPAPVVRENELLPLSAGDRAWNYRDPQQNQYGMGGTIPPHVPWGLSDEAVTQLWDRETRIRCTCAALAAIAYRRSHGEYPRNLADAAKEFATPSLLIDPWTGDMLRIQPRGIAYDLGDGDTHTKLIGGNTPFVWSGGPDLAMIGPRGKDDVLQFYGTQWFGRMRTRAARYVFPLPVKTFPDALMPENLPRGAGM